MSTITTTRSHVAHDRDRQEFQASSRTRHRFRAARASIEDFVRALTRKDYPSDIRQSPVVECEQTVTSPRLHIMSDRDLQEAVAECLRRRRLRAAQTSTEDSNRARIRKEYPSDSRQPPLVDREQRSRVRKMLPDSSPPCLNPSDLELRRFESQQRITLSGTRFTFGTFGNNRIKTASTYTKTISIADLPSPSLVCQAYATRLATVSSTTELKWFHKLHTRYLEMSLKRTSEARKSSQKAVVSLRKMAPIRMAYRWALQQDGNIDVEHLWLQRRRER